MCDAAVSIKEPLVSSLPSQSPDSKQNPEALEGKGNSASLGARQGQKLTSGQQSESVGRGGCGELAGQHLRQGGRENRW